MYKTLMSSLNLIY